MPPKNQLTLKQFFSLKSTGQYIDDKDNFYDGSDECTKVTKKIQKKSNIKDLTSNKTQKKPLIPKKEWLKQQKEKKMDIWNQNDTFVNYKKQDILEVEITNFKELKIISWNINGVRAILKSANLVNFLEKYNPDIFCVNELKIDEETFQKEIKDFGVPGYIGQYFNFCKPPKKGYSGVAIFTKIKPIQIIQDFGLKDQVEGRSITLEFDNFFFNTTYFPHAGFKLERLTFRAEFNAQFHNHIKDLQQKNKYVIYGGDMNVCPTHLDIIKENFQQFAMCTKQERNDFKKLQEELNLTDVFRFLHPDIKKFTLHNKKRIDIFLIDNKLSDKNKENENYKCDILGQLDGSDHRAIILQLQI